MRRPPKKGILNGDQDRRSEELATGLIPRRQPREGSF
jgi:hypothetical protein